MGNTKPTNGDRLELKCISNGGPILEYQWSRSGTDNLPEDTLTDANTLTIAQLTAADAGKYSCNVSNEAGCSSATVTVSSEFYHNYVLFARSVLCFIHMHDSVLLNYNLCCLQPCLPGPRDILSCVSMYVLKYFVTW